MYKFHVNQSKTKTKQKTKKKTKNNYQPQGNKNSLVGNINALGMGPLGSKSPNLQSSLNVQSSMSNNMGGIGPMNSMAMSIANNGTQPMSSMQGRSIIYIFIYFIRHLNIVINKLYRSCYITIFSCLKCDLNVV